MLCGRKTMPARFWQTNSVTRVFLTSAARARCSRGQPALPALLRLISHRPAELLRDAGITSTALAIPIPISALSRASASLVGNRPSSPSVLSSSTSSTIRTSPSRIPIFQRHLRHDSGHRQPPDQHPRVVPGRRCFSATHSVQGQLHFLALDFHQLDLNQNKKGDPIRVAFLVAIRRTAFYCAEISPISRRVPFSSLISLSGALSTLEPSAAATGLKKTPLIALPGWIGGS